MSLTKSYTDKSINSKSLRLQNLSKQKPERCNMEDTRAAAIAYYNNSSIEFKRQAKQLFDKIDADKSGRISRREFKKYVKKHQKDFNPALIAELDKDGDGLLDFEEAIVFYYMINFRNIECDVCDTCMKGIYFTCTKCFFAADSYDLCISCYGSMKYDHKHSDFLDSNTMLCQTASMLREQGSEGSNSGRTIKAGLAAAKIGTGLAIEVANSEGCTIM